MAHLIIERRYSSKIPLKTCPNNLNHSGFDGAVQKLLRENLAAVLRKGWPVDAAVQQATAQERPQWPKNDFERMFSVIAIGFHLEDRFVSEKTRCQPATTFNFGFNISPTAFTPARSGESIR